jgi:beta-lactamase class A
MREPAADVPQYRTLRPVAGLALALALVLAGDSGAGVSSPDPLGPRDPELARKLEAIAGELGITSLAAQGRASLILVDLTAPPRAAHAGLAADSTLGAASIAKLAILTAAYQAAAVGELAITPDVHGSLERMIRDSSNSEATRMIGVLGYERIAAALEDPRIALHSAERGGLWVGRDYSGPQAKLWRAEPRSGQAHAASASSVARFYALLDRGELVSRDASAAMRDILAITRRSSKFVAGLGAAAGVPATADGTPVAIPGFRILRKSGSYGRWQGDSALVEAPGRRYVLVCLLDDQKGGEAKLRQLAVRVDRLMAERGSAREAKSD